MKLGLPAFRRMDHYHHDNDEYACVATTLDCRFRGGIVSIGASPAVMPDRIQIREAEPADNEALLALTRITPMAGTISIRTDRDPDFFALFRLRGTGKVFVAARGREILGCISGTMRTVYVSGEPETVAYIGDLKVHPRFSGARIGLRLVQALEAHLRSIGVDICVSVAAEGNHRVMSFFAGRLGTPQWAPLGKFLVDEMLPSPFRTNARHYRIEAAAPRDVPELAALIDRFHRTRQFAPRLSEDEIAGGFSNGPVLVARTAGNIVATLSLYDPGTVKRSVLLDAPKTLRAALTLLRTATRPLGGFEVPRVGEPLRLLFIRNFACDERHSEAFEALLSAARAEAFRKRFLFVALGLHERDPLRDIVRTIPRFKFQSVGLVTSLGRPSRLKALQSGVPFEDFALV